MNVIAVNGSPRKKWNTATLLREAMAGASSAGASTEMVNLYDLHYRGCISCFACKRKGGNLGHCAMRDGLTDLLESIASCDVLLLGSPIYFGNVTGTMRSFMERLLFASMTYNSGGRFTFPGKLTSAFIYTMNVSSDMMDELGYREIFSRNQALLERLGGPSEVLVSNDTYQFDDYSNYEASMFDERHKAQVRAEQFPLDLRNAFDLGARLAGR